jgi:hypothetical protein
MNIRPKAPSWRRHSPQFHGRRTGTAAALSVLLAASVLAAMSPAQALDPAGVGPRDPAQRGFPAYYTDDSGVALQLCVDGTAACGGATLKSDGAGGAGVAVAPDGEGFWYMATTSLSAPGLDLDIEIAAEAAWLSPTQPISFDRLRIRGHSDSAGDIVVTTPYGDTTVTAEAPSAARNVNFTEDIGCPGTACNFADMTTTPGAHIGTWIVSATPPAGHVGDGVTSERATLGFGGPAATASAGGATTSDWVVMGKFANPNAVSLPTAVDFGNVARTTTKTVRLKNLGTKSLAISTATLTGSASINRMASSTCRAGGNLAIGASCKVDLRYRPGAKRQAKAVLQINNHRVRVSALSSAQIKARTAVQFKAVAAGASGKTRRIVVANIGSLPLKIGRVGLAGKNPGSFDIRSGAPKVCARGVSVRPGRECAVYVGFEPSGFGAKRASLNIRSNALGGARSIALSGSGR